MTAKTLTAGLFALALAALPLTAAPARADSEDVAATLLGFAALVALADALDDDHAKGGYSVTYDFHARYGYRHSHRFTLPARCVLRLNTYRGTRELVLRHCLNHAGLRPLPEYCAAPRASRRLGRPVYGLNCLRAEGYRVAHHR